MRPETAQASEIRLETIEPDGRYLATGAGVAAYTLWGLLVLYWPLLNPAGALEILAHRIVWSLVLTLGVLVIRGELVGWLRKLRRDRRMLLLLMMAGCFVGANWGVYIWAVNSGHVIEASLGYYINPLFSALLGMVVFGERLGRGQWVAIVLAAGGVLWLAIGSGQPPWIALALAGTFGCYGMAKKQAQAPALHALVVESAVLFVPAVVFLVVLGVTGSGHFGASPGRDLLLAGSGLATMSPLFLFGFAAVRLPLVSVGMLQFLTPTIQFIIGVFDLHEHIGHVGLAAYCLVWAGVLVFVWTDLAAVRPARSARS